MLIQYLPKYNKYIHSNSMIIYAMIGTHSDGRNDIYIGSSSQPRVRIGNHRSCLSRTRLNMAGSRNKQYFYQVFGMSGWHVELYSRTIPIVKDWRFVTAYYGAIFGFLFILSSSQKCSNTQFIPEFLKVKPRPPRTEVWWWPGAGAGNAREGIIRS